MSLAVASDFRAGVPQTVLSWGFTPAGIALHWTAGGPGRKGATSTLEDVLIGMPARNASYHELWWWEAATGTLHVLEIVRGDRAAHSMNPRPPDWAPLPEVRRILGSRAHDPNAASYAISYAGMPADLDAALDDPRFIVAAAERIAQLLDRYAESLADEPLFNHGWGQPSTRTDAGERLIPALYLELARRLEGPVPPAEPDVNLARLTHQVPKIVRLQPGAKLFRFSTGDEEHWTLGADGKDLDGMDAELFGELDGRWLGRRAGASGAFFFDEDAIDRSVPFKRAVYGDNAAERRIGAAATHLAEAQRALGGISDLVGTASEEVDKARDALQAHA